MILTVAWLAAHELVPQATANELDNVVALLEIVLEVDELTAVACLDQLSQAARTGQLTAAQLATLRQRLAPPLQAIAARTPDRPVGHAALVLSTLWGDDSAAQRLRAAAANPEKDESRRISAVDTLASLRDGELLAQTPRWLVDNRNSSAFRGRLLDALSRYQQVELADTLLGLYPQLPVDLQPKVIGLLVQRPAWGRRLLEALQRGALPASVLNVNQIRVLLASRDQELASLARRQLGTVRTERNPQREQVLAEMRALLIRTPGQAQRGQAVFHRVCGQCHRIHGVGQDVGPDITSNGRASFDQLLSNVFDPSLVIGPAYQALTVVTQDGRVVTGLLSEDSEQRLVLKVQGGKIETIPREEIDEVTPSNLSLMPEGLERQLTTQELADLFAFLTLDRAPDDPAARPLPGTPFPTAAP